MYQYWFINYYRGTKLINVMMYDAIDRGPSEEYM